LFGSEGLVKKVLGTVVSISAIVIGVSLVAAPGTLRAWPAMDAAAALPREALLPAASKSRDDLWRVCRKRVFDRYARKGYDGKRYLRRNFSILQTERCVASGGTAI